MALTVTRIRPTISNGNRTTRMFDIDLDSSYLPAGEALTRATMGFKVVDSFVPEIKDGFSVRWDSTNEKLIVYTAEATVPGDGSAMEAQLDQNLASTINIRCVVTGR
jgi:hypothetical protein